MARLPDQEKSFPPARVAIVHDWLVTFAGAEKVLAQIFQLFPHAHLFSLIDFLSPPDRELIQGRRAATTFLQKIPWIAQSYRYYLPFMPMAIESLELSEYDLIISSSHAVAKGVLTGPDQLHLSYVHSPMRYAWDMQNQYLGGGGFRQKGKAVLAGWLLGRLRLWDRLSADRVDAFAANSQFVAGRINKFYRRSAQVIYPPVDVEKFSFCHEKEDFYLTASRLVPYKRVDLIVEAFSQLPDRRLVVIGDGPELTRIKKKATNNVQFLGHQPFPVLHEYLRKARAFVFAAKEDFGILPLEAQACGTPVIAFGRGGSLETIRGENDPMPTGLFFERQEAQILVETIQRFETIENDISSSDCRVNAEMFSNNNFNTQFMAWVSQEWENFQTVQPKRMALRA